MAELSQGLLLGLLLLLVPIASSLGGLAA